MSGKVYTFYSYKGGVGRTMALANIGTLLSLWGKKVLMIDWDLEAPGLENYFKSGNERLLDQLKNKDGLIDLIFRRKQNKEYLVESIQWKDHISQLLNYSQHETSKGKLDLLHAGKKDQGYIARVRELDYGSFYEEQEGGAYFEAMREYWISQYDIVLIDSRTGLTDSGGVCSIQMPDALVMLFTATDQGYAGTIQIADRAIEAQKNIIYDRYALKILPVPTRFDGTEFKLQRDWLEKIETGLTKIYRTWVPEYPKEDSINIDLRKILELTKLPYIPYFSYGEKLPVIEEGTSNPQGLGYAYETLAAILVHDLEGAKLLSENRTEYVRRAIKGEDPYKKERELPATLQPSDKSNTYIKYGLIGAVGLLLIILLAQNLIFRKNEINNYLTTPAVIDFELEQKLKYSELETKYVKLDSTLLENVLELNRDLISSGYYNDTSSLVQQIKQTVSNKLIKEMEFTLLEIYADIKSAYEVNGDVKENSTYKINEKTYVGKVPSNPFLQYFSNPIKRFGPYQNTDPYKLDSKFKEAKLVNFDNSLLDKSISNFIADTNGFSFVYTELANYYFTIDSSYINSERMDSILVNVHFNPEFKIDSLVFKLIRQTKPNKINSIPAKKLVINKDIQYKFEIVPDITDKISLYQADQILSDISMRKNYTGRITRINKYIDEKTISGLSVSTVYFNKSDNLEADRILQYVTTNFNSRWIKTNTLKIPPHYFILVLKKEERKAKSF